MIKANLVKQKTAAKQEVFGILNSVPSAVITEMFAYAGYDFVILDTEHLFVTPETLEHAVSAAKGLNLTVFVRVAHACPAAIGRALDAGAQGIVVARVSSLQEAQAAVQASYYPPLGRRGITGGKNTGFGILPLSEYISTANQQIMLTLMIENLEGLSALPEIVQLAGVDMILEGALDLSLAMGHQADFNHPEVQQNIEQMALICRQADVAFCAVPRLPQQLSMWRERGVHTFLAGEDRGVMFKALKNHLSQLKNN
ncbi:HpcH/HpaI aldolase family protein [Psychromonas aquimarina]|uniref:HpcH/HpaI aldolase family protein n=1 Tax=Psychromonas aquimarina TaxID=444919 RepID=UPI00041D3365|nr:aldolase/citrate lyase family protein [Psychromonas aquimarina]